MPTDIVSVTDGLLTYLASAGARAAEPLLADLHLNVYAEPQKTQCPVLDIYPMEVSYVAPQAASGALAEAAVGRFEYELTAWAAQYDTGVRQVFCLADAIRRVLNRNSAAKAAGVQWIRLQNILQVGPDEKLGREFVSAKGTILARFDVEAT